MNKILTISLVAILWTAVGCALPLEGKNGNEAGTDAGSEVSARWTGRDIFGVWQYEHQDPSTIKACWTEGDTLCVLTRRGTYDRTKMHTCTIYRAGIYRWRTYIPEVAPGDRTSVGSWIYCDDHHEVDFEVGWGTEESRKDAGL